MESKSEKKLDFVKFNFDCTNLTIGLKSGFRIYCLKTSKPYYENVLTEAIVVERLKTTSLLAVVYSSKPNLLILLDMQKNKEIWSKKYNSEVLAVQFNSEVMTVCLKNKISIHRMINMELFHTIGGIPDGCSKLSILSSSITIGKCFFIYPCSTQTGNIQVFDILKRMDLTTIHAHDSPIATMVMNPQQTLLATASTKGTVIRLISIPDGQRVTEFRRGVQSVDIYSITFGNDSKFLCCSCSSGTIHVFSLVEKESSNGGWFSYLGTALSCTADFMLSSSQDLTVRENDNDWASYLSNKIFSSVTYVPQSIYNQWSRTRSFANARVPSKGIRCISALFSYKSLSIVLVVSEDGNIYTFKFDPVNGGDCKLMEVFSVSGEITATMYEAPETTWSDSYTSFHSVCR